MTDDKRFDDLCMLVENYEGEGIFMMGHLSEEERESFKKEPTDAYKCGWNDAHIDARVGAQNLLARAESGLSNDVRVLLASGEAFASGDSVSLNMNDTWGWATGWCPDVPKEQLAEVARLFRCYGRAGLLYWHSCQEKNMRSEFHDINRMVDFVRNEERIKAETPGSSQRAYRKVKYTIGEEESSKPAQ